jgi:serine/threonine protein kinase
MQNFVELKMPQFINGYELTRTLGKGAQAKVKLARNVETEEMFAVKLFFNPDEI